MNPSSRKEIKIMTYTEKELKEWFETMKDKYPNSKTAEYLESVKFMMFDKYSHDTLENFKKELTK